MSDAIWSKAAEITMSTAWSSLTGLVRGIMGCQIEITHPRPSETLTNLGAFGNHQMVCEVRGKLKRLPKGHLIWLLTQEPLYGKVWPQGLSQVQYNPSTKEWSGKVTGNHGKESIIIAVVAPPTSIEFFRYYERVGEKHNDYQALDGIPTECSNNFSVQTRFP